ncbi:MAG TPA: LamG domain-containing protein [Planctomycetota bacterium]|nr:LamG domain-containing protein [Planctomycetota bacterium]
MGQEIVYCATCARMLRTLDFEKAHAFRFEGRAFCAECAPPAAKSPAQPHLSKVHSSARHKAVRVDAAPKARRLPWIAAGGALAAALAVAVFMSSGSSSRAPAAPAPGPEPADGTVPPRPQAREDSREKAASGALERAREALRAGPEDLGPVVLLFDEACRAAEGTGFAPQAQRERAQALDRRRERTQAAIAEALKESQAPLDREEYALALGALEKARGRAALPAVREAVEARQEEVRRTLARVGSEVRAQAVQARRAGLEPEVAGCLERAARWGDPGLLEDLKKTLGAIPPPPSPEAGAYLKAWRDALDRAAAGHLAGALSLLEGALRGTADPTIRTEASADLGLLRGAQEARHAAGLAFGNLQKGQRISLEALDENAVRRTVQGTLLRSGPGWIAVKSEDRSATVFIEGEDLTARAIGSLVPDRSKEAALLGILEGQSPEVLIPELPAKYATWARERGAARPSPRENAARRLYHDACDPERDWPERRRKGSSAEMYRKLLGEYADTAFVAARREAIALRAERPVEVIFLPDDLRGHGGFHLVTPDKAPCYWHLPAAPASGQARETYLEIDFEAGSESPFKAWAYVGACCAESLSLAWQVTELSGPGPQGPPVPMDPGSSFAFGLKASVPRLPKAHVPTKIEPTHYAWIALPIPKFASPGPKKARLFADRPGVGVKALVVSSVRPSAPTELEARDFEQVASSTLLQGLVGWWKLDESQGPSPDQSGHGHEGNWVNAPAASPVGPGPLRGGAGSLALSGAGQYVEMANPGTFPSGRSARSLSGWGKPRTLQGGYRWIAAFGFPTQQRAMFIGQNGTTLVGGGFGDDVNVEGFWDDQWHHIALTYDGSRAVLYADGVEKAAAAKSWELDPKFASIGRQVNFSYEFWNGWVDDVRIYDRVLTATEVRQLSEGR